MRGEPAKYSAKATVKRFFYTRGRNKAATPPLALYTHKSDMLGAPTVVALHPQKLYVGRPAIGAQRPTPAMPCHWHSRAVIGANGLVG